MLLLGGIDLKQAKPRSWHRVMHNVEPDELRNTA